MALPSPLGRFFFFIKRKRLKNAQKRRKKIMKRILVYKANEQDWSCGEL